MCIVCINAELFAVGIAHIVFVLLAVLVDHPIRPIWITRSLRIGSMFAHGFKVAILVFQYLHEKYCTLLAKSEGVTWISMYSRQSKLKYVSNKFRFFLFLAKRGGKLNSLADAITTYII